LRQYLCCWLQLIANPNAGVAMADQIIVAELTKFIIEKLSRRTAEERAEIMQRVACNFCIHCGEVTNDDGSLSCDCED
jgi:hypothetical protein